MLTRTDRSWRWLRRYTTEGCTSGYGCSATTFLDIQTTQDFEPSPFAVVGRDDARWPSECERCGRAIEGGQWQIFTLTIYRADDGRVFSIHGTPPAPAAKAPSGAMWFADWLNDFMAGPDGRSLVVICPDGHEWTIDGRASNCTEPCSRCGQTYAIHYKARGGQACAGYRARDGGAHRCWVRHGTPPDVTVDKNGLTCQAGAGSIQTPGWHGFLRNGELVA